MKKIMFNDRFMLTDAVLNGNKTQTRKIIKIPLMVKNDYVRGYNIDNSFNELELLNKNLRSFNPRAYISPTFLFGEEIAIAQKYKDIGSANFDDWEKNSDWFKAGFNNKMFVKSSLMPNKIRLTDIRIELLQDISDEDCIAEGVMKEADNIYAINDVKQEEHYREFSSPKEAYKYMINQIIGKNIWNENPFVWVYKFKLDNN